MREGPSSSGLRVLPLVMSMREERRSELVPLLVLFLLSFALLPLKSLKSYIYTSYQSIKILICIYAAPSYSNFTFHTECEATKPPVNQGDVTNLGGVVGAESGLGMHWPIILGPDVTNLGRVFEARNWLCIPSALILWTTYL